MNYSLFHLLKYPRNLLLAAHNNPSYVSSQLLRRSDGRQRAVLDAAISMLKQYKSVRRWRGGVCPNECPLSENYWSRAQHSSLYVWGIIDEK